MVRQMKQERISEPKDSQFENADVEKKLNEEELRKTMRTLR